MASSLEPQNISKTDWYYEYPSHLLLVHEVKSQEGVHIRTDQIKIPWRMIEASLSRRKSKRLNKAA